MWLIKLSVQNAFFEGYQVFWMLKLSIITANELFFMKASDLSRLSSLFILSASFLFGGFFLPWQVFQLTSKLTLCKN